MKQADDRQGQVQEGQRIPVAAVLERRPAANRWAAEIWQVSGIVAGTKVARLPAELRSVRHSPESEQFLFGGLSIGLHRDEGESYYYNLLSEHPSLYVVCREQDGAIPRPFLATASYDEAAAYMEGEDEVFRVPMPGEIYRWVEAYVLEHYAPERKQKRKRRDWFEEHDHERQ